MLTFPGLKKRCYVHSGCGFVAVCKIIIVQFLLIQKLNFKWILLHPIACASVPLICKEREENTIGYCSLCLEKAGMLFWSIHFNPAAQGVIILGKRESMRA